MRQIIFSVSLIICFSLMAAAQSVRIIKPPAALINFLYQTADGKARLQSDYGGDLTAAVRDLQVKATDIDGDHRPEYFVSRKSLCQNTDCAVTIYKRQGKTFSTLLIAPKLDVNAGWSEGKRNLISCEAQVSQPRCSFFRWYKKEYIKYRCVEADSKRSILKSKEIPCSEMK